MIISQGQLIRVEVGAPLAEGLAKAYVQAWYPGDGPRDTTERADFELQGPWEPVKGDPDRKASFARWADPKRAADDPRQFVLIRLVKPDVSTVPAAQFSPVVV